jgi:hypothetical protein
MTTLSRAAQAVIDRTIIAYSVINNQSATMEGHARLIAAAALGAAVEECTYVDDYGTYLLDPADLLAIATELENGS